MTGASRLRQRLLRYMGVSVDTVPSQRPWVTRISNPRFATSQRDRWYGTFFWLFLIGCAISLILDGPWIWFAFGVVDLLFVVPAFINSLLWIVQRRPTL